ncbi:PPC domain-containing DNA-binding protein [Lysinibacillus sp. ZYM-1]|uniref:PPC domain-containing DNA-binding protein n=1 Tax=Lysinibacillus sp. ZYM-1 TaxID=1681184 RepID=UPI0006CE69CC|nr:PPC domain-containing DNA-binding protein [Lysinibacillus sp. ZYM-1]KPN94990.1 DNA-binding protein [Lysinibacillus sp. ZYM-1]
MSVRVTYGIGSFGKVISARLLMGTDIIEGMEALCEENNIESATIVSCIGSFQKSSFVYLVPDETSKINVQYSDVIEKAGPLEFIQGSGVVCKRDGEGGYETHFHGSMSDQWGVVSGGHFIKGGNIVITVDIVLAEVQGIQHIRKLDDETGHVQFYPLEHGLEFPRKIEK